MAALLSLQKVEELKLQKVIFKGDVSNVVDSLKGDQMAVERRGRAVIESGRCYLDRWKNWTVKYVPRFCNSPAHELAK